MNKTITKRDGTKEEYNLDKIKSAISKAASEVGNLNEKTVDKVAAKVHETLDTWHPDQLDVEAIQDVVEMELSEFDYPTAKAYILYREKRKQERKLDIFKKRVNLKPYEYPELAKYVDAIRHSYWIHTEYNYSSDVQNFHVDINDVERTAITNAMLAISQIEIAVKTFWGDLYHRLPKPELGAVGYTFAESEVRHHDAYSHLLEILGLNEKFEDIKNIPALMDRVNYLSKSATLARTGEDQDYALAVLLFSLFIEHVSLFSQFLIMMAFNKHKNMFKGLSNVIEATSKEENLHGQFGIDLINTIRAERPEWFDDNMERMVKEACIAAYEAEEKVIEWIYEAGDLDFMPKANVKEYVKHRLNNSLEAIGYERIFDVDESLLEITEFMDDELLSTKHVDFFVKRSINYTKRAQSITSDDLF